jgi:hypothetical protein
VQRVVAGAATEREVTSRRVSGVASTSPTDAADLDVERAVLFRCFGLLPDPLR